MPAIATLIRRLHVRIFQRLQMLAGCSFAVGNNRKSLWKTHITKTLLFVVDLTKNESSSILELNIKVNSWFILIVHMLTVHAWTQILIILSKIFMKFLWFYDAVRYEQNCC